MKKTWLTFQETDVEIPTFLFGLLPTMFLEMTSLTTKKPPPSLLTPQANFVNTVAEEEKHIPPLHSCTFCLHIILDAWVLFCLSAKTPEN